MLQLDQVQKRVENSKLELEERKRATREHSEKEISDMDEKFQVRSIVSNY